ncbi:hypothetical protein KGF56_004176 [Candida oxycetoniae]|uniref:DNA-binding protein REB1 n=1 Tax=Candida oxycetoniae TaxID=497107 RepID=A0AAI9SUG4_9ASCO|nr:uncharacterized protein KGF56_004176 [Candida oxycetoniae]KAI3403116.2 hypothetical protein KGF56_004176 [Candida oxycetoniae]
MKTHKRKHTSDWASSGEKGKVVNLKHLHKESVSGKVSVKDKGRVKNAVDANVKRSKDKYDGNSNSFGEETLYSVKSKGKKRKSKENSHQKHKKKVKSDGVEVNGRRDNVGGRDELDKDAKGIETEPNAREEGDTNEEKFPQEKLPQEKLLQETKSEINSPTSSSCSSSSSSLVVHKNGTKSVCFETMDRACDLNEEQQARLLAAANAMVEEEELNDGENTPKELEDGESANTLKELEDDFSTAANSDDTFTARHSDEDYKGIFDIDDLIHVTAEKANKWYEENVPLEKRDKPRPFVRDEDEIIDFYLAGVCRLRSWTRAQLCERIWTEERKVDKFWKHVCKAISYRSQSSVYKHIRRRYHIFDTRAKWTSEDDARLRDLAVVHVGKWKQIGELLGRMPEDCRDRWRNYLKCGNSRASKKWSAEEEARLIKVVNELVYDLRITTTTTSEDSLESAIKKINWTIISEKMNGTRSRIQCRYKWTQLNAKESKITVQCKMSTNNNQVEIWILKKIRELKYPSLEKVNWKRIMKCYNKENLDDRRWGVDDRRLVDDKRLVDDFKQLVYSLMEAEPNSSNSKEFRAFLKKRIKKLEEEQHKTIVN